MLRTALQQSSCRQRALVSKQGNGVISCSTTRLLVAPRASNQDGNGKVAVTFLGAGGQSVVVECGSEEYILDAGLNAGLELPYTCRAGLCGVCVGRVASGAVDQSDVEDLSFCLSDDDLEQGLALLCRSRAVGPVSVETQSDWGYSVGISEWKGATGQITGGRVEPLMGKKWEELKQ